MVTTSEIFAQNNTSFADLKNKALTAMDSLKIAALNAAFSSASYVDPGAIHEPGAYESIDVNDIPTVSSVLGTVNSIRPDVFPTAPSTNDIVKYKKHIWESKQLDTIEAALMTYIENSGLPSTEFQDAVFDSNRERRLRVLNDSMDIIAAKTSGRGFKYAEGQTNAAILALLEKDQFDNENLNREITKTLTEWAKDNLHFAVQQGIAAEQAHMDFAYKYSAIYRELYSTQLNGVLEKFRIQVQQELAKLAALVKVVAARSDVLKANASIVGMEDEAWLKKNQLEVQEALGRFNGSVADLHTRATVQLGAAQAYASTATGLVQSVSNSVLGVANK